MLAPFRNFKTTFERMTGSKIYRNSLPFGITCFLDIERQFGRDCISTVFDVGANAGQSALTYAREFPRAQIYSFEPVPATYQKLVAQTARHPNVHPYNIGMGRQPGRVTIHVNPNDLRSSVKLHRPEDHSEIISLDTMDGFVEKQKLRTIDFLKIDTEGFDLEVLAGAETLLKEHRVHLIQCECEPAPRTNEWVSFPALAEFLEGYGYRVFGVYEQRPEWDGGNYIPFWNAIFICEKLVPHSARWPSEV